MAVTAGEKLSVILIAHSKLPPGKYMVEKDDGSGKKLYVHVQCMSVYGKAVIFYCNLTNLGVLEELHVLLLHLISNLVGFCMNSN